MQSVMGYDVMLQAAVAERSELECNGRLEEPVQVVIPDIIWLKDVRSTVACHATLISKRGLIIFRHYKVRVNQFLERVT